MAPGANASIGDAPLALVGYGVDALELHVYGDIAADRRAQLRQRETPFVTMGGLEWQNHRGPRSGGHRRFHRSTYPLLLVNGTLATVGVASPPSEQYPTALVRLACRRLWMHNGRAGVRAAASAYAEIEAWVRRIADVRRLDVAMIQLAADFVLRTPAELDGTRWFGYGVREGRGAAPPPRPLPLPRTGRGSLSAQVYDKTREIVRKHKEWFRDIWARVPAGSTVWRLEFEFRTDALREVLGAADPARVLNGLAELWRYAAGEPGSRSGWLRLVVPTPRDTNPSRWEATPAWDVLRRVDWSLDATTAAAVPSAPSAPGVAGGSAANAEALAASARGILERVAAERGTASFADVLAGVAPPSYRDAEFSERVRARAVGLGTPIAAPPEGPLVEAAASIAKRLAFVQLAVGDGGFARRLLREVGVRRRLGDLDFPEAPLANLAPETRRCTEAVLRRWVTDAYEALRARLEPESPAEVGLSGALQEAERRGLFALEDEYVERNDKREVVRWDEPAQTDVASVTSFLALCDECVSADAPAGTLIPAGRLARAILATYEHLWRSTFRVPNVEFRRDWWTGELHLMPRQIAPSALTVGGTRLPLVEDDPYVWTVGLLARELVRPPPEPQVAEVPAQRSLPSSAPTTPPPPAVPGLSQWQPMGDRAVRLVGISIEGTSFDIVVGEHPSAVGARHATAAVWVLRALRQPVHRRAWRDLVPPSDRLHFDENQADAARSAVQRMVRDVTVLTRLIVATAGSGVQFNGEPGEGIVGNGPSEAE